MSWRSSSSRWLRYIVMAVVVLFVSPVMASPSDAGNIDHDQQSAPDSEAPVVRLARPDFDTGWYQAEIYRSLLMRIGYRVEGPTTMDNDDFYEAVAAGEVDLWADGWFPLHDGFLQEGSERVGAEIDGGAVQGYFVDIATAEEHNLTNITDLADPEIAALFDADGNGMADLIGCNAAWACGDLMDHHLETFGLIETVEQIRGQYSALMLDSARRYDDGESVLFYGYTPHWVLGRLEPGEHVRWLQTPGPGLPDVNAPEALTMVGDAPGCVDNPCQTGWVPNDVVVVANSDFLDANPKVRTLMELAEIPLEDVVAQNTRMIQQGEGDISDIRRHAEEWLDENAELVDEWVEQAAPNATPVVETPEPEAPVVGDGTLRVAVRQLAPLVIYQNREFNGYSVDVVRELATRLGMDVEIYSVNTIAKQLDDLHRGAADVAVGGIGVTAERSQQVGFTQPLLQTGLGILVASDPDLGLWQQAMNLLEAIIASGLPWMILGFLVVLLVSAHMIWWFERRNNPDFSGLYGRGIWDSLYWATVTITTVGYGDKAPKGNAGRAWALVWMIVGYFVFASFTASITSSLAVSQLEGTISGPEDLPGHQVATVAGTDAETWLSSRAVGPVSYPHVDAAYAAVTSGEVDAVVFDAPVLQHFASGEGAGEVEMVGSTFDEVNYGIAFNRADPEFGETVNATLLDLADTGTLQDVRTRWFGAQQGE